MIVDDDKHIIPGTPGDSYLFSLHNTHSLLSSFVTFARPSTGHADNHHVILSIRNQLPDSPGQPGLLSFHLVSHRLAHGRHPPHLQSFSTPVSVPQIFSTGNCSHPAAVGLSWPSLAAIVLLSAVD